MPKEGIPITPAVIRWGRERAGLTLDELAESFRHIEAWEAGRSFPSYPQLEQLAEKLKLPIAVFFFPEPPQLPPIGETFRTLPEAEFDRIPRRVRLLLRKAEALQLNLNELCQGRNPAERLITRDLQFTADRRVEDLAEVTRRYLNVSLEDQWSWENSDIALKNWRQHITDAGVFVFKDAFKANDFSGFCLYDEEFPIIYVNNSSAKTRQIFTLFHELAHLLFHTSGVDTIADEFIPRISEHNRKIEIICNQFAAEFLVPNLIFDRLLAEAKVSEQGAETLALRFNVSRELIYRKFLDRGLITEAEYTEASARWAHQRKPGDGGNVYWNKISYLGRDYIELALAKYHQQQIDETKLAEYLDTKPKHLSTLEEYFSKGAA